MKWPLLPLQKRLNPTHVEPEKRLPKPFCKSDHCPPNHYVVNPQCMACLSWALGSRPFDAAGTVVVLFCK